MAAMYSKFRASSLLGTTPPGKRLAENLIPPRQTEHAGQPRSGSPWQSPPHCPLQACILPPTASLHHGAVVWCFDEQMRPHCAANCGNQVWVFAYRQVPQVLHQAHAIQLILVGAHIKPRQLQHGGRHVNGGYLCKQGAASRHASVQLGDTTHTAMAAGELYTPGHCSRDRHQSHPGAT